MSRRKVEHISQHVCCCPSRGTVTVPRIGNKPSYRTCRSPICNALRGQEKVSEEQFRRMMAEERLSDAEQQKALAIMRQLESEELVNDLLKVHVDMMLEMEKKHADELKVEREKTAEALVRVMPISLPKQVSAPEMKLKPALSAGKIRSEKVPQRVLWSSPATRKSVDQLAPPLPANFMVGETYVSGIVSGFGQTGF